jgi:hypothetical protein
MGWQGLGTVGMIAIIVALFVIAVAILPYALWWSLTVLGWMTIPFSFEVWLAFLILIVIFSGKTGTK